MTYKRTPMRRTAADTVTGRSMYPWYVLVDDEQHEYFGFGKTCKEAVENTVYFYEDNPDYRPMDREEIEALSCYPATQEFYEEGADDFVVDHGNAMLSHESESYLEALDAGDDDPPLRFGNEQSRYSSTRRHTAGRRPSRRIAEPIGWMDPVPKPQPQQRHLQRDYGLPRRMRLDRWAEQKDHAFDTEVLVAHTIDFWQQYRSKRYTILSEAGSHNSLDLRDWGLMYQDRAGLERNEIELLYRFMAATDLIPDNEYLEFQDVLDAYQVFRYNRVSG